MGTEVGVLVAALLGTLALIAVVTATGKGPIGLALVVGVALSLAITAALFTIELSLLPAVALAAFAFFPAQYLPIPTHDGAFSPALLVIVVLVIRVIAADRPIAKGPHLVPLTLLLFWVAAATAASRAPATSLAWSANFIALVWVPAILLPGWDKARQHLLRGWIALGGLLGAYAVVEFALQRNPILGSVYKFGADSSTITGSVYRVTTTLGHPITNGLFFALATILGASALLRGERAYVLPATLLSALGLLASVSRGPIVAVGIGLAVLFAGLVLSRQIVPSRGILVAALSVVVLFGAASLVLVGLRGTEATGSTASHVETLQEGNLLVRQSFPWGGGPGLTDADKRLLPSGDKARGVESSAYQLLIGLGVPGFLLSALVMLIAAATSLRTRPEVAACVVAYVVSASTYNLLESNRPALLLWGLLIGVSSVSRTKRPERSAQEIVNA